MVEGYCSPD
uniref:Uncharacterized protein n=1 Tax=Rhizophora mucronata TaxID=61149 RepID=A0A2P2JSH9_RHIMU